MRLRSAAPPGRVAARPSATYSPLVETAAAAPAMRPFEPRPVRFHGLRRHGGWKLKVYSITAVGPPPDWQEFEPGAALALAALPPPAPPARPGAGFLIGHRGRTERYVVLAWWDRENELPARVFVAGERGGWRPARDGESFCVWDLEVFWFERQAWVDTVLAPGGAGRLEEYLERHLAVEPTGVR